VSLRGSPSESYSKRMHLSVQRPYVGEVLLEFRVRSLFIIGHYEPTNVSMVHEARRQQCSLVTLGLEPLFDTERVLDRAE
jgi:hypothetical protein